MILLFQVLDATFQPDSSSFQQLKVSTQTVSSLMQWWPPAMTPVSSGPCSQLRLNPVSVYSSDIFRLARAVSSTPHVGLTFL